jgi:nitrogen fixation protein NifU and related proteins
MMSPLAAEHVQRLRNCGPLEGATHYGSAGTRGEGPYTEVWLAVKGGVIERAAYRSNGCPFAIASASVAVSLVQGRPIDVIRQLEERDLILVLGGLPEGKEDTAARAVTALRLALGEG